MSPDPDETGFDTAGRVEPEIIGCDEIVGSVDSGEEMIGSAGPEDDTISLVGDVDVTLTWPKFGIELTLGCGVGALDWLAEEFRLSRLAYNGSIYVYYSINIIKNIFILVLIIIVFGMQHKKSPKISGDSLCLSRPARLT